MAAKQVAAAAPAWASQAVQPQHAEAELLQGGEAAVPIANQVADLETILQERDACGVSGQPRGVPAASILCPEFLICCGVGGLLQVGFIANLKAIKSHTIVEQVGLPCFGGLGPSQHTGGSTSGGCGSSQQTTRTTMQLSTKAKAPCWGKNDCKSSSTNLRSHTLPALRCRSLVCAPPLCLLQALRALGCMEHRGACSADDDSGDGAGLMTQIPWKLLQKEMPEISETNTG